MAKFVFELEALLRKRLHDEREQMGRVAAIERERIALEDEIRGYQSMIIEEKEDLAARLSVERDGAAPPDEWAEPPGRSVDLRAVRMQANASLRLIDRAQRAVLRLKGVHDRLDAARLDLVGLTTKRRAIELLKEQRYEAWRRAVQKREQMELDEIAVLRHGRGNGFDARDAG